VNRRIGLEGALGALWVAGQVVAFLAGVGPAAAQRPYDAAEGFLVHEPVTIAVARESCLTRILLGTVAPVDTLPCQVREIVTMDTADAWWWTMVRYRRGAIERFEGTVDTVDFDEVVLFGVDRARDLAVPIWHLIRDRSIEFIDGFRWSRKRSGLVLVVDICLNGTGGCYEAWMTEYAGDHWAVVEQSYLSELASRAPEGFGLHWGRRIDLETLTGEQPIAKESDANCCPSGLMRFSVWLDGRRLRLITAEVVKQ